MAAFLDQGSSRELSPNAIRHPLYTRNNSSPRHLKWCELGTVLGRIEKIVTQIIFYMWFRGEAQLRKAARKRA